MENKIITKLPLWETGANKNHVNWELVNGCVDILYNNIQYKVLIKEYNKNNQRLKISLYKENEDYKEWDWYSINTSSFMSCKFGKFVSKKLYQWLVENDTEFEIDYYKNKTDLNFDVKTLNSISYSANSKLYIKCKKCGSSILRIPNDITSNHGCGVCSNNVCVEGINSIANTSSWMVKYFANPEEAKLYTSQSNKKIKVKCPDCGKEKEIVISNLFRQGFSCNYCSDRVSYPNKFLINLLQQLKIKFKTEYSPKWIKPKRYDFYFELNNKEYIVEMDGGWHRKDNKMSGQTKEGSKFIDDMKDKIAEEHGVEIIRIDCDYKIGIYKKDYIKDNILNSKVIELFDLSNIDWIKCDEFANKNLIIESCKIKKENPHYSTGDIAKIFKVCTATIREYLKIGNLNGWCEYNPKNEAEITQSKNVLIIKDRFSKKVEVFKENISLGIFESCQELSRQSEELFGVKLLRGAISEVARGDKSHYKRFVFKYV